MANKAYRNRVDILKKNSFFYLGTILVRQFVKTIVNKGIPSVFVHF